MKIDVSMKFKTRTMCAKTGRCLKERPWQNNLLLDAGLNSMAQKLTGIAYCVPAALTTFAQVGSGTTPNSFASGAVTLTQATTAVTASAGFFTAGMVGGILKYLSGVQVRITGFTSSTLITVDTSLTIGTPTTGTVWMVQQTALVTKLFETNTYQTNAGDCQTTFTGANQINLQRTYTIAPQGSPYTVNELGYSPISGALCAGRAVLSSSDVVGTSNYYVIVIVLQLVYSPSTPTAVLNVGTNINTAGNAMFEAFSIGRISSTGVVTTPSAGASFVGMDGTTNSGMMLCLSTWTQNSAPDQTGQGPLPASTLAISGLPSWTFSGSVGKMTLTISGSATTAGQTLFGIAATRPASGGYLSFSVKFTTPFTLPTGTFSPATVFSVTYSTTLP